MKGHQPALDEFAELIGSQGAVSVRGGATRWLLGGSLDPSARVLGAPVGVVAHVPDEMTVTVLAGTTVSQLNDVLAARGQRCAIPDRGGTVGGAIVVGEDDVAVMGKGRIRDSVLQVRYVSDSGKPIFAGGPTVKNVTGYDIAGLMVGSLGTLGCLAEVILRTNPVPAVSGWYRAEEADPLAVFNALYKPASVLWDGASTWILLEGHLLAVRAQLSGVTKRWTFVEVDGPPLLPKFRWSLTPAGVADARARQSFDSGPWVASVGVGTVWASVAAPVRVLPPALRALNDRVKREFDPAGRLNPGRDPSVLYPVDADESNDRRGSV